jgi:hypothetical protein
VVPKRCDSDHPGQTTRRMPRRLPASFLTDGGAAACSTLLLSGYHREGTRSSTKAVVGKFKAYRNL